MTSISIWVLSIAGVVLISVILDIILPNGSMAGFIKNIFAYVIILVIISPIFAFISKNEYTISDFFETDEIVLQDDFISSVNKQMLNSMEEEVEKLITQRGITGVEVGITADIFEKELKITKVSIDLSGMVIKEDFEHMNIKKEITECVRNYIKIEKENIVFYE